MAEDNEPKCCCGCMSLDKGVTVICLLTIIESVILVSNITTLWFFFALKLILTVFFIFTLCNMEAVRFRKILWILYLIFGIIEMIGIVAFSMAVAASDAPATTCAENVKTDTAIEYMEQNKMTEQQYLRACVYSYKFYVFVFAFVIILLTVPFRAYFAYTLIQWEHAGNQEA